MQGEKEFGLSKRGYELSKDPHFVTAVMKVWSDLYHPQNNPNGYINLAVAENVLMANEMCEKIDQVNSTNKLQPNNLNYTDFAGDYVFRQSLAHLFQKYIFDTDQSVDAKDFIAGNGAGTMLEMLGTALCDAGEAVLVPSPMYLALPNDFGKRFDTKVYPVPLPYDQASNTFALSVDVVNQAYQKAKTEGVTVRAFLLLNPNNPTGEMYPAKLVEELIEWCRSQQIHFISDEVYALSVFEGEDKFVSAGKIMLEKYSRCDFVHLVYSFSKDFTLNGFRVGVLYTHNSDLMTFCRSCSYFTGISSHTQHLLSHVITDDEFMQRFIKTNAQRLKSAYQAITTVLDENKVPYIDAKASMFLFINLSQHIAKWFDKDVASITSQDEAIFWQHILDEAKVNISAGNFFLCTQAPGWFRICFTSTSADILRLGLKRVFDYLAGSSHKQLE